ncbi:MAG: peptidylprolyl isomerase [Dysgonamonadaceae bacterium]|jgi:peptidyl-prolyl cis-trans isomerase SurA|nr:peptidylprolyl isomerase [Dysgonamonadaceae bacterium]
MIMKRHSYLFILLLAFYFPAGAQNNDPVVMTVNGKDIHKSEFLYSYSKNNTEETVEKKTIDEYVDLFKNFKLWIAEGEAQKIDTTQAFHVELADYREQLAKPYLTDLETDEFLIRQEYEHMGQLVKLSHILIAFPGYPNSMKPLASDTVELYKKAQDIRNQLKRKGVKFADLVEKYSDDTQSKVQNGTIGWFSGMNLNYRLEQGAFAIPAGETGIVRSNWGYHIVKVEEKQPYTGEYHVAHILVRVDKEGCVHGIEDKERRIHEAYDKIVGGADFKEIAAEYSEDRVPSGDLGWIELHRTVPEFWKTVENLKENEISHPFRTDFGFHIAKLIETREPASYEEKKDIIKNQLFGYGYFIPLHRRAIERLKQENYFRKNEAAYGDLLSLSETIYPSDAEYYDTISGDTSELFSVGDRRFTVADFAEYMKTNNHSPYTLSTEFLADRLENYEYQSIIKERDANLEDRYPEFRNLMQEYRDGIILFEIKNREIWNKASTDSAGLADFFAANREKYAWDSPRFKGYVVLTKDEETAKQLRKQTAKMQPEEAVRYALENFNVGEVSYVKVEKGLFAKGDNIFVDRKIFKSGDVEFPENFSDFLLIGKTLKAPESPEDVKNPIIIDYQDYLEKLWIERLNDKYPVKIYREALESIN